MVSYFPRRIFSFLCKKQNKYFLEVLLLKKDISKELPPEIPRDRELGLMNKSILSEIVSHDESLPEDVYQQRIANGDICYYQKCNGELVGYNWISFNQCSVFRGFEKGMDFQFLNNYQTFIYDFYTYKPHRNKGYGLLLKRYVLADLKKKNKKEIFSCIEYDNSNSLNIHLRLNYNLVDIITCFALMGYKKSLKSSEKRFQHALKWIEKYNTIISK